MSEVTESEYKGYPIIEIPIGNKGCLRFGVTKALAILDNIVAIGDFANKYRKQIEAKDIYRFGGESEFVKYCKDNNLDEIALKNQIKGVK
jgi:hypothetical protein